MELVKLELKNLIKWKWERAKQKKGYQFRGLDICKWNKNGKYVAGKEKDLDQFLETDQKWLNQKWRYDE